MKNLFIFAGTTEGRALVSELCAFNNEKGEQEYKLYVFTATEYGCSVLAEHICPEARDSVVLIAGRLDEKEIEERLRQYQPEYLIDCTHPHATTITENLKQACEHENISYLRLLRDELELENITSLDAEEAERIPGEPALTSGKPEESSQQLTTSFVVSVDNLEQAAQYLREKEGNILLATGSKELKPFASDGLCERTFIRMLPQEGNIEKCATLGFSLSNLICMQGPFSEELNRALIRQYNIKYLITKDSGTAGGFEEKVYSAAKEGVTSVVIRRPLQLSGYTLPEILRILGCKKIWFPLFTNISKGLVVVIGGGIIALRRVKSLLRFDCHIQVVAPELCAELEEICVRNQEAITVIKRPYCAGDCAGSNFATAATSIREVNHAVAIECAQANIPVSIADSKEESSFYFPAVIHKESLVVGLCSGGQDHALVRASAQKIRKALRGGNNASS